MRTLLFVAALAGAAGCSKSSSSQQAAEDKQAAIETVTVDQLDTSLAKNDCQAVDANGVQTRKKLGVIPGAVLLSDGDLKTAELPADKAKTLVFYCANTECGASHHAAEQAITAGYTHVKVLPAGIAGWVKAGKKTQQI